MMLITSTQKEKIQMKQELNNLKMLLENIEKDLKSFSIYSDNPTPQQRMNRLKFKRWWRSFLREGELLLPFFLGIMLLGLIAYITITNPNL